MKKCYGLLLVLFIMFGFSLNIYSNTSALRHNVTTIPYYSDRVYTGGNQPFNPNFRVRWWYDKFDQFSGDLDFRPSTDPSVKAPSVFYSFLDPNDNRCKYNSSNSFGNLYGYYGSSGSYSTITGYPELILGFQSFSAYTASAPTNTSLSQGSSYRNFSTSSCNQLGKFGESNPLFVSNSLLTDHPVFDDSSLVNIPVLDRPPFSQLPPYYYSYSGFYLKDTATNANGLSYSKSLSSSDLTGISLNKFTELTIPFDHINTDVTGPVDAHRPIEWDGHFTFPGISSSHGSILSNYFIEHGSFHIGFNGLKRGSYDYFQGESSNCSITSTYADNNGVSGLTMSYKCTVDIPYDIEGNALYFWLYIGLAPRNNSSFSGPSTQSEAEEFYVWDCLDSDWIFSSAYVVTDNDPTLGADYSRPVDGADPSSAPGSASSEFGSDDVDWFSSLINLFKFNSINPFSGLFDLFGHGDQCANIPILASMLHSNESTYCPWFSASTRNILTPVISISATMLLFGFFVRWLGASSGNFFDDSGSHSFGSFNVGRNKK